MTTNHHTIVTTGAAANASVINSPLAQLDSAITSNATSITGLTSTVQTVLNSVILGGAAVTLTDGAANAAQKVVTVDSSAQFVAGCYVEYTLVGGAVERNTVDTVDNSTQITLVTNIGTGGIANNSPVAVIPVGFYNALSGVYSALDRGASPGASAAVNAAAINSAIVAASATGGKVTLGPGTFTSNVLYYASNVTICGTGIGKTTLKLANSQNTPLFSRSDAYLGDDIATVNALPGMTNVVLRDMTLDGNESNQSAPVGAAGWDWVVWFQRIDGGYIENVEIVNGKDGGICLSHCKNTTVSKCLLDNNVQPGSYRNEITSFRNYDHSSPPDASDKLGGGNIIAGNHVTYGSTLTGGYTISCEYTNNDIIEGNICVGAFIGLEGARNARVANNTILRSLNGGIILTEGDSRMPTGTVVIGNIIEAATYTATASEGRGIGIACYGQESAVIANNTILSPTFTDVAPNSVIWGGILIGTSLRTIVQGNVIKNGDTAMIGVYIDASSDYSIVTDNIIEVDHANGIDIASDACVVNANIISNLSAGTHNGIALQGKDCIASGNIVKDFDYTFTAFGTGENRYFNNLKLGTGNMSYQETRHIAWGEIKEQKVLSAATIPTTGTAALGDICWSTAPASGQPPGWICTHSGTFSAATDSTGDTDGTTAVITGMTDTSDFYVGSYVDVSAGFASGGPLKVVALTATTMTLELASNAVASNITVNTSDPVWTAMGNLA